MMQRWLSAGIVLALLAGCAGGGGGVKPGSDTQSAANKSSGGRYAMEHDAYPSSPPDVSDVPDAVPMVEPLSRSGNRPVYEVWGKTYQVMPDPKGYADSGKASWYGEKFQGYATASGEIYDMYKMTAAHRSLPLPTYAQVTNIDNGRTVIVKVNDRGPFHDDRLIDLSYAAAARLDILQQGTGNVRVEAIDPVAWQARQENQANNQAGQTQPAQASAAVTTAAATTAAATSAASPASSSSQQALAATSVTPNQAAPAAAQERLYLQVAALGSVTSAQQLQARLQSEFDRPVRVASDEHIHRVQVGPLMDRVALEALRSQLQGAGYDQVFTITATD